MSPATVGWLCLALALLPLGTLVGMCVAERYRVEYRRDMWRIPWREAAMAKQRRLDDENRPAAPATTLAEVDERTEFAEELPPAIERCSGYVSPTVVLLDEPRYELPEGVEGIPIGTRWPIPYEPRHGEHATAPHSAYRARHSLLDDITDEFAAIVAGAWSDEERQSLAVEWWCLSCRGELEHGRAHEACDACALPLRAGGGVMTLDWQDPPVARRKTRTEYMSASEPDDLDTEVWAECAYLMAATAIVRAARVMASCECPGWRRDHG